MTRTTFLKTYLNNINQISMFFKKRDDEDDLDPSTLTVKELSARFVETINDAEFLELVQFDLSKYDKKKLSQLNSVIEDTIRLDPRYKGLDKKDLLAFKSGVIYGLGLMFKMATSMPKGLSPSSMSPSVLKKLADVVFIFKGIDSNYDTWDDDHWVDNLLKNAVIAEPKKKK